MSEALRPLTAAEDRVFRRLFECSFPGRDELVTQLQTVQVATLDPDGGLALHPDKSHPPAVVKYRVPIEGSYTDSDGVDAHVLLHVVNGYMDELEIFKEDGSPVTIAAVTVTASIQLFCPTGGEPA